MNTSISPLHCGLEMRGELFFGCLKFLLPFYNVLVAPSARDELYIFSPMRCEIGISQRASEVTTS
jgi:hypothetical protein